MNAGLHNSAFSLKAQAGYVFIGKSLAYVAQLLLIMVLVRLLERAQFGIYREALLVAVFFNPILSLGFPQGLYYFFPNAKGKVQQLLFQTQVFLVITSLLGLFLLIGLKDEIAGLFPHTDLVPLMIPIALYTAFLNTSCMLDHIFILERKPALELAYSVSEKIVQVFFVLAAFFLFRSIYHLVWSMALFAMAKTATVLLYLFARYGIPKSIRGLRKSYFYHQMRYSIPLGLAKSVGDIGRKVDQYMAGVFLGPADFALYSVVRLHLPLVEVFYQSVGGVALPRISQYAAAKSPEGARLLWHKTIVAYASLTIPVVGFLCVMAEPIMVVAFTSDYMKSAGILRMILPVLLVQMLSYGTIPRAYESTSYILLSNVITFIVGITLGYFMISRYRITGAALCYVIAFTLNAVVQLVKAKSILRVGISDWLPWKPLLNLTGWTALAMSFPAGLRLLHLPDLGLLIAGSIGYVAFVALLLRKNQYLSFRMIIQEMKG